jgi:ribokinase
VEPAIVVVGSVNVDLIVRVPRLPLPGETVIGGRYEEAPGGKGANAAAAAARLGARTWFVGLVGKDELGARARRDLEASGVDVTHLGMVGAPTGVAAIVVDQAGENLIAVASGANAEFGEEHVRTALDSIDVERAVVLTNLEISDAAVAAAASAAGRHAWPLVLNPAPARPLAPEVVAACEVIIPNETEAADLGGVDALFAAGARAVVVTRGAEGSDLHRPGQPVHQQTAFPADVADTTGAGDAFSAALCVALAEERGLEEAVRWGAAAGALASRGVGARSGLPTRQELERLTAAGSERSD